MFPASMIDFLNWTYPSNFFDADSNRTGRVMSKDKQPNESKQSGFSPIEMMRSIARWENEGGAVRQTAQPLLP
jgi:hypothetical protein